MSWNQKKLLAPNFGCPQCPQKPQFQRICLPPVPDCSPPLDLTLASITTLLLSLPTPPVSTLTWYIRPCPMVTIKIQHGSMAMCTQSMREGRGAEPVAYLCRGRRRSRHRLLVPLLSYLRGSQGRSASEGADSPPSSLGGGRVVRPERVKKEGGVGCERIRREKRSIRM